MQKNGNDAPISPADFYIEFSQNFDPFQGKCVAEPVAAHGYPVKPFRPVTFENQGFPPVRVSSLPDNTSSTGKHHATSPQGL